MADLYNPGLKYRTCLYWGFWLPLREEVAQGNISRYCLIIHALPQGVEKVAGDWRMVHMQWRKEPMHYVAESYFFFPKLLFTAIGWDIPLVPSP